MGLYVDANTRKCSTIEVVNLYHFQDSIKDKFLILAKAFASLKAQKIIE